MVDICRFLLSHLIKLLYNIIIICIKYRNKKRCRQKQSHPQSCFAIDLYYSIRLAIRDIMHLQFSCRGARQIYVN